MSEHTWTDNQPALGVAGKAALDIERRARREAEQRATALKKELDETRDELRRLQRETTT